MKIMIAGGGTAGHINPGIAIANKIKEATPEAEILFVGTHKGLEKKLIPREGFPLELIRVRGFRRKISLDTLTSFKELIQGIFDARRLIKNFKPDLVIGTGGYVCGPVLFQAARMKIPTLIHEQNAFPGATNRILSRFVDVVAISFKESELYFKKARKLILTGNPVRREILQANRDQAREALGVSKDERLVVIFGGSRGAEKVNDAVAEMIEHHLNEKDCRIIFATGELLFDKMRSRISKTMKTLDIVPYIFDMANTMAAADLVVCRAGAITISELTVLGKPSVMIPSPYVTANHQEHNARSLMEHGAAEIILEKDLNGKILYEKVMAILNHKEQLLKMSVSAGKMGRKDALEQIYEALQTLLISIK